MQQLEPPAQIPAGHLARARFLIDIAADAVQIERERVFEGLRRVLAKELGFAANVRLPAEKGLFQMPAPLVHFAVNFAAQLLAERAKIRFLRLARQAPRN